MKDTNDSYHVALHLLHALLITADKNAATLVLQRHFTTLPPLSEAAFLAELSAVMVAYHTWLDHLNVIAAARRPEYAGLRTLIKQDIERRLSNGTTVQRRTGG